MLGAGISSRRPWKKVFFQTDVKSPYYGYGCDQKEDSSLLLRCTFPPGTYLLLGLGEGGGLQRARVRSYNEAPFSLYNKSIRCLKVARNN